MAKKISFEAKINNKNLNNFFQKEKEKKETKKEEKND